MAKVGSSWHGEPLNPAHIGVMLPARRQAVKVWLTSSVLRAVAIAASSLWVCAACAGSGARPDETPDAPSTDATAIDAAVRGPRDAASSGGEASRDAMAAPGAETSDTLGDAATGGDAVEGDAQAAPDTGADSSADVARTPDGDAADSAEADATEGDAASDAGAPAPIAIPDPPPVELYDCRAMDAPWPDRTSPVPLSCVLDPQCSSVMVVGHRGAGGEFGVVAPENTLAAVRAAILIGVDGVEVDVRDTKDGALVLMHDAEVDRTTDGTGKVDELTLDEIEALHVDPGPLAGEWDCLRVPTLAELFAATKGRLFIDLDLKTNRIDLVAQAVEEAGVVDEVFFSSGSNDKLVQARALLPGARIQVRPDTLEAIDAATALFDPPPEIYEVPTSLIAEAAAPVHALGRKVFADIFAHDLGAGLQGDASYYLELFDQGVDIVQSERPLAVLAALGR